MNHPKIGDLILLRPQNGGKSVSTLAQTFLRGKTAHFSHAAVSVGEFFAIHSMPAEGVHVVPTSDFSARSLKVFRHKRVDESLDL